MLSTLHCSVLYAAQYFTLLSTLQCSVLYAAQYFTLLSTLFSTLRCSELYAAQYSAQYFTLLGTFALKLFKISNNQRLCGIFNYYVLGVYLSSLTVRQNIASLYVTRIGVKCQGGQRLIVKDLEGVVLVQYVVSDLIGYRATHIGTDTSRPTSN
jgi:hypothetical protein